MAITLGTNISSYSARMQLNSVSNNLSDTFQRLSTGQKINKAGDDSAGLVISQNMEAKIRGSKQAMTNIQAATSFLTVAEDGMVSITEHFQRINDLLTSMANDSNDIDSRKAAVDEVIERLSEIDRLAETTNFNGRKMLNGSKDLDGNLAQIIVQMGPDADSTSIIDISSALSDCHISAFNAELPDNLNPNAYLNADKKVVVQQKYGYGNYWLYQENAEASPKVVIQDDDGNYVYATKVNNDYKKFDGDTDKLKIVNSGYVIRGTGEDSDTVIVSDGAATPKYYTVGSDAVYDSAKLTDMESYFAPTNEHCRNYMAKIQDAIGKLAKNRGLIGAYENRMESSYDSLTTRIESLEEAKVPYTDTDIAQEASELVKKQIMQQINVSILSSANTNQQLALSLLGG